MEHTRGGMIFFCYALCCQNSITSREIFTDKAALDRMPYTSAICYLDIYITASLVMAYSY